MSSDACIVFGFGEKTHTWVLQEAQLCCLCTSNTPGEPLSLWLAGRGWGVGGWGGDAHKALAKDWTMAFISQQNPNGLQM